MPTRDTTIIGAVHALTSYRDHRDALRLLERIAVQVQPVMRARRWHVPSLQEFFPPNPNLLGINVNAGKLIRIRLRPSHAPDAFLPYEDLLGTMLHELAHIVRGPHDAEFYRTLDALRDELEAHMARTVGLPFGFEAFTGSGRRLGHGSVFRRPVSAAADARRKAVDAAERRRRANRIGVGGGMRLGDDGGGGGGGSSASRTCDEGDEELWRMAKDVCSPREMAAMAAMRRARDAVWCGSVGLDGSGDASQGTEKKRQHAPSPGSNGRIASTAIDVELYPIDVPWTCAACTLVNRTSSSRCECCGSPRATTRVDAGGSSSSSIPGESSRTEVEWTCPRCTLANPGRTRTCEACEYGRA